MRGEKKRGGESRFLEEESFYVVANYGRMDVLYFLYLDSCPDTTSIKFNPSRAGQVRLVIIFKTGKLNRINNVKT